MPVASSTYGSLRKEAMTVLEGEFNVVFQSVEATKSGSGKSMFKFKARTEDGPHEGHMFYGNITVSPESQPAMKIFFTQMETLGADEAFFNSLPNDLSQEQADELIARKIEGARAKVRITKREWQGVERENVDAIMKPGPMTGGVASPLASMGGVQATQLPSSTPAATPTSPAPTAGPVAPTAAPPTPY